MDCPIKKQCGSCQYIGMDYAKQLLLKKKNVKSYFLIFMFMMWQE
ncbi:hypothetical protein [Allocoprobacillus halotolerans]|nr:hypothetical protein [Allocoprobacillus halotolerans]